MSIPTPALPDAQAFDLLNRSEQLAVLRRASARQKINLLLNAVDGDELLAMLPPQDLYLVCRELGPDQVPELLSMANAEQWTALLDFDCWEGDRFVETHARDWLAVMLEESGEERIVAILQRMNFELLVLLFQREVAVLSGPEEIEESDIRAAAMRRDGGYQLEFRDEAGAKLFGALLDILFRLDADFFRYLLEAVRAEGESLLEESVYQQRARRLLDLGVPDPEAARSIYAWLDPETFAAAPAKIPLGGSTGDAVPGQLLQLANPSGLLGEVLAAGGAPEAGWELACLVNKVLMADRVELGDLDAVRAAGSRTVDLLNLALEYLAGRDVALATATLAENYLEQLFRLGFSLTLRLQRRAQVLRRSSIGPYLDGPFRTVTEALQHQPRFPESLVRPERGGLRPFASLCEVRLVEEWLERLEGQRRLFEESFPFALPAPADWDLNGCHPGEGAALTLSTIFLTALANRLLGRPFAPEPVPAGELAELQRLVSRGGQLDPALQSRTVAWLETLTPTGGAFGDFALNLWNEELCRLAAADLDPRYLSGLIARYA